WLSRWVKRQSKNPPRRSEKAGVGGSIPSLGTSLQQPTRQYEFAIDRSGVSFEKFRKVECDHLVRLRTSDHDLFELRDDGNAGVLPSSSNQFFDWYLPARCNVAIVEDAPHCPIIS